MKHHILDDDTLRADRLQLGVCEDGHVHITLKDANGKPFADASLSLDYAKAVLRDIRRAIDAIEADRKAKLQ